MRFISKTPRPLPTDRLQVLKPSIEAIRCHRSKNSRQITDQSSISCAAIASNRGIEDASSASHRRQPSK